MNGAFPADWLALREPADAAARATALLDPLRAHLAPGEVVVRDLGAGTGSMARWLAGRLPGPQRWTLVDGDPALLARAGDPGAASDGRPVTVTTQAGDLTELRAADLAGTDLVTASALLDLLTADEVAGLAAACVGGRCAVLLTLSVAGRVALDPPDPLDRVIGAAFDAHQRRRVDGRTLLGPDAAAVTAAAFARRGWPVRRAPSPWRLGPADAALTERWMHGWVGAAQEQGPAPGAEAYLHRRLDACAAGRLRAVVAHHDLLALPPP